MKKTITLVIAMAICLISMAQLTLPAPSPNASFTQKFGLTEIKVEYSRPGVKGRKIFGGLIPFGDIWRAGANDPTKFTTTDSVTIAGTGLPKGTYIVLARPGADEWEIIFNKNPLVSYTNYIAADDVARIKVKPIRLNQTVELFTISANPVGTNSCNLELAWENTLISMPMVHDVDSRVMAQIKQKNDGPSPAEYNAMARYYYDNNKDAKEALGFAEKGIAKGGETFPNLWLKSVIQARLGDKKGAVETAKKSLDKAKAANNTEYTKLNEKNIAEWSK